MIRAVLAGVCLLLAGCSASDPPRIDPPSSAVTVHVSPAPRPVIDPLDALTWPLPDRTHTPGALTPGCVVTLAPRPGSDRQVTDATKAKVLALYGLTGTRGLDQLEYDHDYPFALCGSNGADNIWPELTDGVYGTGFIHNRKDQLENYAVTQVKAHLRDPRQGWTLPFAYEVIHRDWRVSWCQYRSHYRANNSAAVRCP